MPAAAARPCTPLAPSAALLCSPQPCCHHRAAQQQRSVAAGSGRKGKGDPTRPQPKYTRKPKPPVERLAPKGFGFYETMLILNPQLQDDEKNMELARLENFLNQVCRCSNGW